MKHFLFILYLGLILSKAPYPVAIFHALGASCDNKDMAAFFSEYLDGVYVKCIETGAGFKSLHTSITKQAETACSELSKDKHFHNDFSIIGLSQGALIGRYIIQECEYEGKGDVKRYISIGGPQMGIGEYPNCHGDTIFCRAINKIVKTGVYNSFIQDHFALPGYFKDINNYNTYLESSSFLAKLNNEVRHDKFDQYRERMLKLEKMLLIKFKKDTVVLPKESAWFEFYSQSGRMIEFQKSIIYKADKLGLKKLNERGGIIFSEINGKHLEFERSDVILKMIPVLAK
jgi:palmitoyl-protein thioesterase